MTKEIQFVHKQCFLTSLIVSYLPGEALAILQRETNSGILLTLVLQSDKTKATECRPPHGMHSKDTKQELRPSYLGYHARVTAHSPQRNSGLFAFLLILPSAVLAFASVSKLKGAYAAFYIQHLTFSEMAFNILLPLVEFLIALGLVLSVARSILPSAIAFCIYIGYLIQVKLSGGNSCNCFGGYEQDIRFVMALDFICLGILLISNRLRSSQSKFRLPAMIVVAIPVSVLFWVFNPGFSKLVAESFSPGPLRATNPSESSLVATADFLTEVKVTNRSRNLITIKRILASCGCTSISPEALELKPGESTTLSVTIDLTKSYSTSQSSMQHNIEASCYDAEDNVIAKIGLYKGWSFRTFSVENRSRVFPWNEQSANEFEVPITWFSKSNASVVCSHKGEIVGSANYPDPIRLKLERPSSFFEKRRFTFSRVVDGATSMAELDISVVAKPQPVACDFLSANNLIALSAPKSFEKVGFRVYDSFGRLLEERQIGTNEEQSETMLPVGTTKIPGNSYFDLTVSGKNVLTHRIIIPFFSRGANDE